MLKALALAAALALSSVAAADTAENAALKEQLLSLLERDQAALKLSDGSTDRLLREHVAELREIIASHGWPKISQVGKQAAQAAWLVAQHADFDREFQREALTLMETLAKAEEAEPKYVAYLKDRLAVAEDTPQHYGTQGGCVGSQWQPKPILDLSGVDARRAELSMEPLSVYQAKASRMLCSKRE